MPPKLKIWTTDLELHLIHEVRSRPILWDVAMAEYRRSDHKELHWDEVAKKLGSPFSSDIVKKRFNNMRDTFMENHRKVRGSRQRCSGKSPDEIFVPKWHLYNSLLFLLKTVAQAESMSNMIMESNGSQSCDNDNSINQSDGSVHSEEWHFDMNTKQDDVNQSTVSTQLESLSQLASMSTVLSGFSSATSTSSIFSPHLFSLPETSRSPSPVQSPLTSPSMEILRPASAPAVVSGVRSGQEPMYSKRGVKKTPLAEETLNIMKKIAAEPVVAPTDDDDAEKFGTYVASKLRKMDAVRRERCEAKIVEALYE